MLTVVTSLNDKFDSSDALFSDHITSLNQAASVMYSNATQSLQVTSSLHSLQSSFRHFDQHQDGSGNEMPSPHVRPLPPSLPPALQVLSDLLAQTLAVQSTVAKTAAATASLLQSNLLDTMSSLSQSTLDRLTTQLIEDGYTDMLVTVLGNFTACLRHAAANPKTFFKVFRYSTPPDANATVPSR